jgi:hypothetical protein
MNQMPFDLTDLQSIEKKQIKEIKRVQAEFFIDSAYKASVGGITITSTEDFQFLGNNESNSIVYESIHGTKLITTYIEGGLQILYEMRDQYSPKEVEFELTLPVGCIMEITDSHEYIVRDSNGEIELLIGKPWAIDSEGSFVETEYKIEGNRIIQIIHYDGDNYPLVADPLFCTNSIDNELTIWDSTYGDGRGTLSVYPTTCAKIYLASIVLYGGTFLLVSPFLLIESSAIVSDMYEEMASDYSYQSHVMSWQEDRIADQFSCHAFNPAIQLLQKYPWNLEPWRPDVSLLQTFIDGCNPPLI